ncbi:MAG: permease [Bacteroidales bacterium]|nr:permease [Bacteroidales bacterium]
MLKYIKDYLDELFWLMNEMSIYLLIGFLFAGILHVFFAGDKMNKYLGKNNFRSVLYATLLGIPLPLCSCGVIPTGVSFYKNGASKGATTSFLISTPQTGVDSILITLPFAIIRPIVAFITGILGGTLVNFRKNKKGKNSEIQHNYSAEKITEHKLKTLFKYGFVTFLQDLSKWLIIGVLIAALIGVILPEDFFTSFISNQYIEMLVVLVASIPMYICATGSVPIAAMLMLKGLSPGAALVLLMAGPATNAATITVIGKSLGRKTLIKYLVSIITGALFFGILINNFLPKEWFILPQMAKHAGHESHEMLPFWIKISSTILLVGLILNGYFQKYFNIKTKQNNIQTLDFMKNITVKVEGMTCNHCKMTVEKNISKIEGISEVIADPIKSTVVISGEEIDLDKIKELVNELGYEYKGEM